MFAVQDGQLQLMDGIALWGSSSVLVKLPVDELELLVLRTIDDDGGRHKTNDVVLLQVPDAGPLSYWGDLAYA